MNVTDCARSVFGHILLHFPKVTDAESKEYVKNLQREYGFMQADHFADLCREVSKTMKPYKPPMLKEFDTVFRAVGAARKWASKSANATTPTTPPAPKLNPEEETRRFVEEIKGPAYKPRTARKVLRDAKAQAINFPPDIVKALEEKAAIEDADATPSPAISTTKPTSPLAVARELRERVRAIEACEKHNSHDWRRLNLGTAVYHAHLCDDCMDILLRELGHARPAVEAGPVGEGPAKTEPPPVPTEQPAPAVPAEEEAVPFEPDPPAPKPIEQLTEEEKRRLNEEAESEGVPF